MRRRSGLHSEAEFREAYEERDWEAYRRLLAILVEFAPPGQILDVGSGSGLFVECCRKFGLPAIGLEGSMSGGRAHRKKELPIVVGRLEDALPFPDSMFASVVANQVVEHLYPETAAFFFREASRVLVPGGVLLVESPSVRDSVQRREPGHVNLYLPSRLRREVTEAGFQPLAERNGPLPLLGKGRLRNLFALGLLRVTGWQDLLSSSANIVARRPL